MSSRYAADRVNESTYLILLALVVSRGSAPGARLLITLDSISMCYREASKKKEHTIALGQAITEIIVIGPSYVVL